MPKNEGQRQSVGEVSHNVQKSLVAAENKVMRLSKRMEELTESKSSVRKSLTAKIIQLETELRLSKELQNKFEDKCMCLEVESNNMNNRISELQDKLQLSKQKDTGAGGLTLESNSDQS